MLRIEEVLIVLALVVAFAITGTMDSYDAEISASTARTTSQETKP